MSLPAIPEPSGLRVDEVGQLAADVEAWLATVDDIDVVAEAMARVAAVEAYLAKRGEPLGPIQRAARLSETRIGELLGPPPGRGKTEMNSHGNSFDTRRRMEFRTFAADRDRTLAVVEDLTTEDPPSATRRQVLRELAPVARRIYAEREATERANADPPDLSEIGETFPVLYADPPWRYEHVKTNSRAIENQYPTMDHGALCALPVPADDDSVLLLWATAPKLAEALDLVDAWGFEYRTCLVWVKDKIGMGYYARQRHELLLVGARGALAVPVPSRRPDSVIEAPRGAHSAKPDLYELIDRMWPGLRKLELFARRSVERSWWSTWGNDRGLSA
jgi:N6-adenosine-specific RNA methylase IME4